MKLNSDKARGLAALTILIVLCSFPVLLYKGKTVAFGDDASTHLLSSSYFEKNHFAWSGDNLGKPSTISNLMPYISFSYLLERVVGVESWVVNHILILLFQFLLPALSMFFLLTKGLHLSLRASMMGVCLYVFNPWHVLSFNSIIYNPILVVLPISTYLFGKILTYSGSVGKGLSYSILFSLVLSFASSAIAHVSYTNAPALVFLSMLLFFSYHHLKKRNFTLLFVVLLRLSAAFMIFVALNAFWIVNDLPSYLKVASDISDGSLRTWNSIDSTSMLDVFRLTSEWPFKASAYNDYYFPVSRIYYSPLGVVAGIVVLIIVLLPLVFHKRLNLSQRRALPLLYLLLFAVMGLAAGSRSPFPYVFRLLYENVGLFTIFRSPTKLFLTILFLVTPLFSFSLEAFVFNGKSGLGRSLVSSLVVSSLFIIGAPLFFAVNITTSVNGMIRPYYADIPEYYYELKDFLETSGLKGRVFTLPFERYGTYYLWRDGGNATNSIASDLVRRDTLTMNVEESNEFESGPGAERLVKYLSPYLNAQSFVLERDRDESYNLLKFSPTSNLLDYSTFDKVFRSLGWEEVPFGDPGFISQSVPIDGRSSDEVLGNIARVSGKTPLSVYLPPTDFALPRFYVPKNTYFISGSSAAFIDIFGIKDFPKQSQFYFFNSSKKLNSVDVGVLYDSESIIVLPQRLDTEYGSDKLPSYYIWDPGWSWPDVYYNVPSLRFSLAILRDKLAVYKTSDPLKKMNLLMWSGARSVEGARKSSRLSQDREKLVEEGAKSFSLSLQLLKANKSERYDGKSQGDKERYWTLVSKLNGYLQRSLSIIQRGGEDKSALKVWEVYSALNKWVGEEWGPHTCNLTFKVPQMGDYSLYEWDGSWRNSESSYSLGEGQKLALPCPVTKEEKPLFTKDELSGEVVYEYSQVPGYSPSKTYELSFDYTLMGEDIRVAMYESLPSYDSSWRSEQLGSKESFAANEEPSYKRSEIFDDLVSYKGLCIENRPCSGHYSRTFTSKPYAKDGFLLISSSIRGIVGKGVSISSFSFSEIKEKRLALVMDRQTYRAFDGAVEFERVNPTKYRVRVTGVKAPFCLNFLENFDEGWRVYLSRKDIQPRGSSKLWKLLAPLDSSPFETWYLREISLDSHFRTNGYSNSWKIIPQGVCDSGTCEFVVEYLPQRYLYVGMLVSLATLILSLLYLLITLVREVVYE